ncbi:MAG: hypothetical protein RQ745_11130 [Longimicrobiales bacterium]|nr:hypothetical protein [Longimicrobiales bacterium]
MNRRLRELLREAGVEGPIRSDEIVMLHNNAPVPTGLIDSPWARWPWGFNFIVLHRGRARWFCKCRAASDPGLRREADVAERLGSVRTASIRVPAVRYVTSGRFALQVAEFLDGVPLDRRISGRDPRKLRARVDLVLSGLAELLTGYLRDLSSPGGEVVVEDDAAPTLQSVITRLALDTDSRDALKDALSRAGRVRATPQHSDLWTSNVLEVHGVPWVIDFETFGDVRVPLYDDLTLVSSTLDQWLGEDPGVPHSLFREGPVVRDFIDLLAARAAKAGLDPGQLDGILVFQLVRRSFDVAGAPGRTDAGRHDEAVRSVAKRLATGRTGLLVPS